LAFHPRYAFNRAFYVFYTAANGDLTIARYLRSAADVRAADPASGTVLLSIPHGQFANHNGGKLAFGPDGHLYAATGDGGSRGDPNNQAQNVSSLLGKLLRIAVDGGLTYTIPPDNPFAGNARCPAGPGPCPEIWAYGLRNPWKFSFDRVTGDLFIGDVGQNAWEEIDYRPASGPGGANFGWRLFEGVQCFNPATGCTLGGHSPPILQYPHDATGGFSVTGGYRYRGLANPTLAAAYVYGDFSSRRIWSAVLDAAGAWTASVLFNQPPLLGGISSFGESHGGELVIADYSNGKLWAVDPVLAIAPRNLAFPRTAPGAASPIRTVSITNRSAVPVEIQRVATTGEFGLVSHDCATLAPGAVCRASLRFLPVGPGAKAGALVIESGASGGGAYRVALAGNRPAGPLADFDGDGRHDLAWRTAGGPPQLWMLQGSAEFHAVTTLPALGPNWGASPGDFDGDGVADLFLRNAVTGQNTLWTLRAGGLKGAFVLPAVADTEWGVAGVGDFDGNERADILWRHAGTGENRVWLMNGASFTLDAPLPSIADAQWSVAGTGDLDGNGRADVVWRNAATGENRLWLMNGGQAPAELAMPVRADVNWQIARIGDFDGNGRADLAWRNRSSGANDVWFMNGAGLAGQAALPAMPDRNWTIVGAGDHDADGRADLLWINPVSGGLTLWFMGAAGRISEKLLPRPPAGSTLVR
jgi:hypothetical protein